MISEENENIEGSENKYEMENDEESGMMEGNGRDNGLMNEENDYNLEDEMNDEDDEEEEDISLKDFAWMRQLNESEQKIIRLLDVAMSLIETLTNSTKGNENIDLNYSKSELESIINLYFSLLKDIKTQIARHIHYTSLHPSLNCEFSTYAERKRIEIENRKSKFLTMFNVQDSQRDVQSNLVSNNDQLDTISQQNFSVGK
ncbi:hypothetical protein ABK040_002389 [Willaertia magna]